MTTLSDYYASTAYDSTNKRVLAPLDRPAMNRRERFIRQFPLSTRGCHCNEFMASSSHTTSVYELKDLTQSEYQELLKSDMHKISAWASNKNKRVLVESVVFMAWWFWVFGMAFSIFFGLIDKFDLGLLYFTIIFFFTPFLVWCLGKLALARDWVTEGNNIDFNRQTGMITFPWKKEQVTLPFDEFDPYLSHFVTYVATQKQFLWLVHRYSEKSFMTYSYFDQHWQLQYAWEEIQRFMDISQPLPDIPEYEFVRVNDPVSYEYDKTHHRPKDYWKNLDIDKVDKMEDAAIEACKNFPWGKTREQAFQEGWLASGVGEGDWQTKQKDTAA